MGAVQHTGHYDEGAGHTGGHQGSHCYGPEILGGSYWGNPRGIDWGNLRSLLEILGRYTEEILWGFTQEILGKYAGEILGGFTEEIQGDIVKYS